MSLLETAARLEIPQRFVFAFYTAASTLNHVEFVAAEKSAVAANRKGGEGAAKRGLLRKILDHLQRPRLSEVGVAR